MRMSDKIYKCDDNSLMKLVAKGDSKAFERLFVKYNTELIKFSTAIVRNSNIAKDIAQDVWMRVVKFSAQYDCTRPFRPWLITIARNLCFTEISKMKRSTLFGLANEGHEMSMFEKGLVFSDNNQQLAEEKMIQENTKTVIRRAIDSLPYKYRESLIAWLDQDDFVLYLVKKFEISSEAVHQLIYRGKKKLQYQLANKAYTGKPKNSKACV